MTTSHPPRIHPYSPRIGLNMSLQKATGAAKCEARIPVDYLDAVEGAGGVPICIPPFEQIEAIRSVLTFIDAFLFIGGEDYWPGRYGGQAQPKAQLVDARRDRFDVALAQMVMNETDLPVLGICGGHQLLAIARAGVLTQDIRTKWNPPQGSKPLPHAKEERRGPEATSFRHALIFREGSLVARATGCTVETGLIVNSFHHQAVSPEKVGEGLSATAWSADGVIEALEPSPGSDWFRSGRFILGVQWHPERMQDQRPQRRLFRSFIEAAAGRRP